MNFGMSNPRIYWHNKKPVPSVSTIMKIFKNGIPFNWPARRAMDFVKDYAMDPTFNLEDVLDEAVDDAERYMKETADMGTAIHDAISNSFITGERSIEIPDSCPAIVNYVTYEKLLKNAWSWIDKYHVEPILVERALSCELYAGTLDLYCEIDSEAFETKRWCKLHKVDFPQPHRRVKALLDWKVTNSFNDDMPVKLSAYRTLLVLYGYDPEALIIARFSKKTGSINIKDYTDEYNDSIITFDLATQLFHHNFKKYLKETEQEADRQRIAKIERKNNAKTIQTKLEKDVP